MIDRLSKFASVSLKILFLVGLMMVHRMMALLVVETNHLKGYCGIVCKFSESIIVEQTVERRDSFFILKLYTVVPAVIIEFGLHKEQPKFK